MERDLPAPTGGSPTCWANADGRPVLDEQDVLVTSDGLERPAGEVAVELGGAIKVLGEHEDHPEITPSFLVGLAGDLVVADTEQQRRTLSVQAANGSLVGLLDLPPETFDPRGGLVEIGHRKPSRTSGSLGSSVKTRHLPVKVSAVRETITVASRAVLDCSIRSSQPKTAA